MATNAPLPQAEAKVQIRIGADWRDSLEIDPIMLPVELGETTDVFYGPLMDLIDILVSNTSIDAEYRLVWSASGRMVQGLCPVCDNGFPVSDGGNGDTFNEGYDAVWCGCDPRDNG